MALTAQIQAAVDLAFAAADDLVASVWLTRQQGGAYDPATGDVPQAEAEFLFEGVVDRAGNFGTFSSRGQGESGSEVEASSVRIYLKPGETDPEVGDVLRIGDERFRINSISPVKPDGVTVLIWELEVSV